LGGLFVIQDEVLGWNVARGMKYNQILVFVIARYEAIARLQSGDA